MKCALYLNRKFKSWSHNVTRNSEMLDVAHVVNLKKEEEEEGGGRQ